MANYYYNKFDGDKKTMEFLYNKCFIKEGNTYRFSLQTIKPQPKDLDIINGSNQQAQYLAFITDGFKKQFSDIDPKYLDLAENYWGERWNIKDLDQNDIDSAHQQCLAYVERAKTAKKTETPERFKDFYGDCVTFNDYINIGRQIAHNMETYGHKDWYTWRYQNWGSKWDTFECTLSKDDYLTAKKKLSPIFCTTANGLPDRAMQALCKDNPQIKNLNLVTQQEEPFQPWSKIEFKENKFTYEERDGYIIYQEATEHELRKYGQMPFYRDSLNPWDYDTPEKQFDHAKTIYEKDGLNALCVDKDKNILLAAQNINEIKNICKVLQEGIDIEDEVIPNVEAVIDTESGEIYELDNYHVAKNSRSRSGGKSKGGNAKGRTPNKQYGKQYDVNGVDENKPKRDSLKINAEIARKQQMGTTVRRR